MIQLFVTLLLALPAYCYEQGTENSQTVAGTTDVEHEKCPCCPAEEGEDSDNCSTCGYCKYYAPLMLETSANYTPTTAQLVTSEQFTKLADIHIPIFVPPQNLA